MRVRQAAALVVGLLALGIVSGCGGDEAGSTTTTTTTTTEASSTTEAGSPTEAAASGDPLSCLEGAGLTDVEARSSDFWRGYHASPFYMVSVERLASQAEARDLAKDAIDVYAAHAGAYVIVGPAKPSAGGLVTPDEATEARRLVAEIASCLGG